MGTLFDSGTLPEYARLIARDDIWIEGEAVAQFARVAGLPGCLRAAAMPDLHPGRGIPVGAAFAFADVVYPALIGGDAGCGARVVVTEVEPGSRDALERRVRAGLDVDPLAEVDPDALLTAVWARGVRGLVDLDGVPGALALLAELEPDDGAGAALPPSGDLSGYLAACRSLPGGLVGSIGGGNHFAELAVVDELRDAAAGAALGLVRGRAVVVAHSGSRGLGGLLAQRWATAHAVGERAGTPREATGAARQSEGDAAAEERGGPVALDRGDARGASADRGPGAITAGFGGSGFVGLAGLRRDEYLGELAGACRVARANRFVLAFRLLRALGAARPGKLAGGFDVIHNHVQRERVAGGLAWVHRKGAAPAAAGQPTIVLGSRGAPSWIMAGCGADSGLSSVAHGAGRRMGRSEARAKIKARYRRKELARTELGGRVICEDPDLLCEEHPDVYKPIAPIVELLDTAALARPIASLTPIVTVKR